LYGAADAARRLVERGHAVAIGADGAGDAADGIGRS